MAMLIMLRQPHIFQFSKLKANISEADMFSMLNLSFERLSQGYSYPAITNLFTGLVSKLSNALTNVHSSKKVPSGSKHSQLAVVSDEASQVLVRCLAHIVLKNAHFPHRSQNQNLRGAAVLSLDQLKFTHGQSVHP